jgi:hypothetical protein
VWIAHRGQTQSAADRKQKRKNPPDLIGLPSNTTTPEQTNETTANRIYRKPCRRTLHLPANDSATHPSPRATRELRNVPTASLLRGSASGSKSSTGSPSGPGTLETGATMRSAVSVSRPSRDAPQESSFPGTNPPSSLGPAVSFGVSIHRHAEFFFLLHSGNPFFTSFGL